MQHGTAVAPVPPVHGMPRKQTGKDAARSESGTRQFNFRASDALSARLEAVAEALGLDHSNLVRMIILENLPAYERRVEQLRGAKP
jgi:CBS-domain-containing membrane protein